MITLRRASERRHHESFKQEDWHTFDPQNGMDPLANGFGSLALLDEIRAAPRSEIPGKTCDDLEIVTYVHEGTLAFKESLGRASVLQAGEFQCMTFGHSQRHSPMNASRNAWAHFYQIWLRPSKTALEPEHVQKRFTVGERRGGLCVVASLDARRGSLRIHQDALICSALLDPGQHVAHELASGRCAWLHVVEGEVIFGDLILTAGDGVGTAAERVVSLTAQEGSEILLIDTAEAKPLTNTGDP
jgi:quercetin 2,3-dioxygenase